MHLGLDAHVAHVPTAKRCIPLQALVQLAELLVTDVVVNDSVNERM
jgi:hypothetical protein